MRQHLQITFHGMERSEALEQTVRRKCEQLERLASDIVACRVVIDLAHKHQRQGRPFGVRIDLTLPGRELTANRVDHEDVYVGVREAFDDMRRQLDGVVTQRRP